MKKDYENLFSEILNSEDGEEIINKILNYFDLPRSFIEKSEYNIENEEKKINEFRELYLSKNGKRISRRKIASYLA
jgi:DNA-binding PadR family transcriptional regulator